MNILNHVSIVFGAMLILLIAAPTVMAVPPLPSMFNIDCWEDSGFTIPANPDANWTLEFTSEGNSVTWDKVNNSGDGDAPNTVFYGTFAGNTNLYSTVVKADLGTTITISIEGYQPFTLTASPGNWIEGTQDTPANRQLLPEDTTPPEITLAVADPSTIFANGTDTTTFKVKATDPESGIDRVTMDLTQIGRNASQLLNYHKGSDTWWYKISTTIVGTFQLPVNVTNGAGISNTSMNITLTTVSPAIPPTNLTATLNPNGTVTLTWNGTANGQYDIYITENYTSGFPSVPNDTVTGTTWIDMGATSYSQRYYRVGTGGIANENETVGKYEIDLVPEWNMISTPLNPTNTSIKSAWSTIESSYDKAYSWNAIKQDWDKTIGRTPTLTDMYIDRGYWIHMTTSDTLILVGTVQTSTDFTLVSNGWTMVGYPSLKTRALSDVIDGLYDKAYSWNATKQDWDKTEGRTPTLTKMTTERGYMVHCNSTGGGDYTVDFI